MEHSDALQVQQYLAREENPTVKIPVISFAHEMYNPFINTFECLDITFHTGVTYNATILENGKNRSLYVRSLVS